MGFVEYGDDSAPAAYRPMHDAFRGRQSFDGYGIVVFGDLMRGFLCGVVVENIRHQPHREKLRETVDVVEGGARLAANTRHSTGGVRARYVIREVEVKELGGEMAGVRECFCGRGTGC